MNTKNELTVDDLKSLLEKMSTAGHGNDKIVIPYNLGHTTIGGRPYVSVTDSQMGIDWDHGKIFLNPSEPLGLSSADLLAKARKAQSDLGRIQFLAGRLGHERGGTLEEQVAQFKAALDALVAPSQAKKMSR